MSSNESINMKEEIKLARNLSPVNVWAMALGCIIGWGAFVMPGDVFLRQGGPLGSAIAIGIASLLMIVISLNYAYMINKFPVAGGEFYYTQKAFGERHAVFCAWFLVMTYITAVPLNATALGFIAKNLLPEGISLGKGYTVAEYDVKAGEIIIAISAIIIFAVLSIRGVKLAGIFQTALIGALVIGVVVIAGTAIVSPKASFSNLSPGFRPEMGKLKGILMVATVAPWAFAGFDTIPQAAEEISFSQRKTRILMILAIVFGASVYIILNTVTAMTVPEQFDSWVSYVDGIRKDRGVIALPTFYSAKVLLGETGVVFLSLSVLAAILSGIVGFYMATSRLLYSMSHAGTLPEWFGSLHPKYRTPHHAILFIAVISMGAPFFGRTVLGWIVDMSSIGAAIGYGYTSMATLIYSIREKNMKYILTGIMGSFFSLLFVFLLIVPIPQLGCSLSKQSYFCLIIWAILGFVFYKRTKSKMTY